jgi:hypothetical protein
MNKHQSVYALHEQLQLRWPSLTVVDYWESDMTAIGFMSKAAPGKLVYVRSGLRAAGTFAVICEYDDGRRQSNMLVGEAVDFDAQEHVLIDWLGLRA